MYKYKHRPGSQVQVQVQACQGNNYSGLLYGVKGGRQYQLT